MNRLKTGMTTAAIAAAVLAAGTIQAPAASLFLPQQAKARTDIVQVRDGWYRGYRGYRDYRPGYRRHNDWWFPAGAFVAGALIGGAIANSNSYSGGSYYEPRSYAPLYYEPAPAYHPPGSSYRTGYREGYRDGYYGRGYGRDITCTDRLQSAGKC